MYRSKCCYIHFIKLANKSGPTKSPNTLRSKSKSKPFPPSKKEMIWGPFMPEVWIKYWYWGQVYIRIYFLANYYKKLFVIFMYNDINADKSNKELFIIIINVVMLVISMQIKNKHCTNTEIIKRNWQRYWQLIVVNNSKRLFWTMSRIMTPIMTKIMEDNEKKNDRNCVNTSS